MRDGAFAAETLIGSGAMGQVWRGRHVRSGTPVALKLVRPLLRAGIGADAVRREARAVAGLAHPHVVWVYDQGEVGPELAQATDVPEGTPYLVMEHLSGGDLGERHERPVWDAIRDDLRAMLEALAHCHARGVIHRDLKPGNVLFGTASDARAGLMLTDFGIAATADEVEGSYGTPQYCAPEQHGDGAPFGPWTDLYAVGALLWRLVTGATPFVRWRGHGIYLAKMDEQLPPFQPRCAVPKGLEGWLRHALGGAVGARFQCAPDALYALEEVDATGRRRRSRAPAPPEMDDGVTGVLEPGTATAPRRPSPPPAPLDEGSHDLWDAPVPPPALRDAGLGLWQSRRTPLFSPGPQRRELREAFAKVVERGRGEAVLLHGLPGVGRSRLVRWLGEALSEQAGIHALVVPGGAEPASSILRTVLGEPAGATERLAHRGLHGRALEDAVQRSVSRPDDPEVARQAACALVWALGRTRPCVIAIDDADPRTGGPHVGFVRDVLAGPDVPVLVVMAARTARVAGARALTRVDPLPPAPMAQLLGEMLPLEAESVRAVAEGSGGRPRRAIELLERSWAAGRWTQGPTGIRIDLDGPPRAPLPTLSLAVRGVLERVAIRGIRPAVDAACVACGDADAARAALKTAESLGLVDLSDGSVDFGPGVRSAMLASAGDGRAHHRAWAAHLPISLDRGWHRMLAGEVDAGFAELASVLEDPETRVGLAVVVAHAERALSTWEASGRRPGPGAWSVIALWRAVGRLSLGDGLPTLRSDLALARRHGLRALEARLRLLEAEHLGTHDAVTLVEIRDLVAPPDGDAATRAIVERALRLACGRAGDWDAWELWLARCRDTAREADDPRTVDLLHELEADAAAWEGRWVDAYAHIARCDDLHPGYTDTRCALFALAAGDLPEARRHARRGVTLSAARQDRRHLPWALLAESLVEAVYGDAEGARRRVEDARRATAEHTGRWGAADGRFRLAAFAVAIAEGGQRRSYEALKAVPMPHNPSPQHHAVLTWAMERCTSRKLAAAIRAVHGRLPGRGRPIPRSAPS